MAPLVGLKRQVLGEVRVVWMESLEGTDALTYLTDCHATAFTSLHRNELRARTRENMWCSLMRTLWSGLDVQAFASKRCLDNTFS
jgi:hypothetical protein